MYAALQLGRDLGRDMAQELGLGKQGMPTDGMMSNLLRRLDVAALQAWAAAWPEPLVPSASGMPEVVPLDGKTLRGGRVHASPSNPGRSANRASGR